MSTPESAPAKKTALEKALAFERWAKGHRHTPPLSDEAVSRASLIRDAQVLDDSGHSHPRQK